MEFPSVVRGYGAPVGMCDEAPIEASCTACNLHTVAEFARPASLTKTLGIFANAKTHRGQPPRLDWQSVTRQSVATPLRRR